MREGNTKKSFETFMFVLLLTGIAFLSIPRLPSSRAMSQMSINKAIDNELLCSLEVDVYKANVSGFNPLLIGANVTVTGPENASGIETGTIVFNGLPPGSYVITASETGFLPTSTTLNLTSNSETTIYLTQSPSEITSSTTIAWFLANDLWIFAIMLGSEAILGICTVLFFIAATDRLRRRRRR